MAGGAPAAAGGLHHHRRRRSPATWCCSFASAPQSPDRRLPGAAASAGAGGGYAAAAPFVRKMTSPSGSYCHTSPSKLAGFIDPRRILSPGRVSPIDSDPPFVPLPEIADSVDDAAEDDEAAAVLPEPLAPAVVNDVEENVVVKAGEMDLRLCLRGKDGKGIVVEMEAKVLFENSEFFAEMASGGEDAGDGRIEVDGVENIEAFKDAIEMMYTKDADRWLVMAGVSRAIDVLEVSNSILFERGIKSCMRYLEAVPWSEHEEEKLKNLFARCKFDEAASQDVLSRLRPQGWSSSDDLAIRLIESVANGTNTCARKEMQSLVNGLLSKSSVYHKDLAGLNKGSLYDICYSCLDSLTCLFEEATNLGTLRPDNQPQAMKDSKPIIERVSKQTENLNWLLEILINNQMAEDFASLWARQDKLIRMHEQVSPMIRYEVSRITASVFIAIGKGKLQCRGEIRSGVFFQWFGPLLADFGWLQRCPKGLDMRILEENMGHAVLTLPLQQQQHLFEEWFRCFASRGTECPNLSRAFQVWWRRSFVRSLDPAR